MASLHTQLSRVLAETAAMDSHWSSFLVVAAVFSVFSGAASVWGHVRRRRHLRQQATWQALLQTGGTPATAAPGGVDADAAKFSAGLSDSDSRRAALDEALDRMSRPSPAPAGGRSASDDTDWIDTEPSVTLSAVLPHGTGHRTDSRSSPAA